ncbi:hypothetical protein, partial [Mesorhizobium sp. P17.1]
GGLLTSAPATNFPSAINLQNKTPPKIDGVRQQSEPAARRAFSRAHNTPDNGIPSKIVGIRG